MSSYIDNPVYATLAGYAVLGGSAITFAATPGTTLTGGVYGSNPTSTVTGFVNGASVSTGNNLSGDADARTQCTNLYNALNALTPDFTALLSMSTGSGTTYTFEPGVYNITGPIDFVTGDSIVFTNTSNALNPQWVIIATTSINFASVTTAPDFSPATDKSIYWVAGNSISINAGTTIGLKGVFMAGASITLAGSTLVNKGAFYAGKGNVTFVVPSIFQGFGFPAICFLENTPINTDQGILPINKLIAGVHTINNKRIVAITKTRDEDTFLVCFKKDSLGENIPNQDTITSKYHGVEHNGEMMEAHQFLDQFENVVKVEYNNETMYNILMDDHEKIIVNNLICETLNPEHPYAKKYNRPTVAKMDMPTMEIACA